MTVSTTDSVIEYVSGGPAFPIPYRFLQDSDIEAVLVKQDGTSEELTAAQYTLTGAGSQSGGTLTSAYAAGFLATPGASLTISRVMDPVQPTDLRNQGRFLAETHESVFDRLTMLIQQGFAGLSRALKRPIGKNYYDAEGRRIANLGDPVLDQDAVSKLWTQQYVGSVIGSGQGPLNLASNVIYIDPYSVPKVVQDMSGDQGAALIGYKAPGTNTVKRDIYKKVQREIELADYLPGGADDTVRFQNLLADIPNKTTSRLITFAGMQSSYAGTTPKVIVRAGDYSVGQTLIIPAYFDLDAEDAIITGTNASLDIFSGQAYQWRISGLILVGGRNHFDFYNANTNGTMVDFEYCQSHLAGAAAVNTRAIGTDGLGNAWSHLSCGLTLKKYKIMACRQAVLNCCDGFVLDDCWVQPNKNNMAPSTAVFVNKGASASDPNPLTRMEIRGGLYIPDLGAQGVDRVDNVRWVDNYGSFLAGNHARFGGENGGIPIVWQQGGPNTSFPWVNTEVVLKDATLFSGPDTRSDSGVLGIIGAVPNRFVLHNCPGPVSRPPIVNLSSLNIPAFMSAFEAATGRKAYDNFKIDIDDVTHDLNNYTPIRSLVPNDLYPYLVKGRSTRTRKQTQSLGNAFAVNLVSFDTIEEDNLGAFAIANPTRLVMPNGCSKMTISVSVFIATDGAAKTVSVDLVNSGGTLVDGTTGQRGINPDIDRIKADFEVSGPPGTYWSLRVRHNAAAALNMTDCKVKLTPTDAAI